MKPLAFRVFCVSAIIFISSVMAAEPKAPAVVTLKGPQAKSDAAPEKKTIPGFQSPQAKIAAVKFESAMAEYLDSLAKLKAENIAAHKEKAEQKYMDEFIRLSNEIKVVKALLAQWEKTTASKDRSKEAKEKDVSKEAVLNNSDLFKLIIMQGGGGSDKTTLEREINPKAANERIAAHPTIDFVGVVRDVFVDKSTGKYTIVLSW